jgi:hypothetical protein
MNSEVQYLADARYSVTAPANSSASVSFAIKAMNLRRILVEPIYSPGGEENEPNIFFGPTHCKEMLALQQMPMLEWLKTFSEKHFLPRPDSLEDLLAIEGLEELWLSISPNLEIADGIFSFLKDFSNERKIILLADFPMTRQMPFRCADPTGKHDFFVCNGLWSEKLKNSTRWHKSIALRGDGHSVIRTRTVL